MIDKLNLALFKRQTFTSGNSEAQASSRGEQAEALVGNWALDCGLDVVVPDARQRGFDLLIEDKRVQVKQRTTKNQIGGGYVIDGLRLTSYAAGLVDYFILVETLHPTHLVNRVLMVPAKHVFEHPDIYFSEYNNRHQLTAKRFEAACIDFGIVFDAAKAPS